MKITYKELKVTDEFDGNIIDFRFWNDGGVSIFTEGDVVIE